MNKLFLRKNAPSASHLIISGPPLCGKLSLARLLLGENALIIDLFDIRTHFDSLSSLDASSCVIIANAEFIPPELAAQLAATAGCIITSRVYFELEGFSNFELNFLDFEEFCSIYKGHNALGDYLLRGRAPSAAERVLDALSVQKELAAELGQSALNVLATCANFMAARCSVAELFRAHTERFRMGKNEFYACINELIECKMLFFLPCARAARLFFGDFGMKNALSFSKNFAATFANLIACELLSLHDDLRVDEKFDFYSASAELGVIADAFCDEEFMRLRMKKLAARARILGLKRVLFLSFSARFSHELAGIKFIAEPLENWLLSKDEALN